METGVRVFFLFEGKPIDCGPEGNYAGWSAVDFEMNHYFLAEIALVPVKV